MTNVIDMFASKRQGAIVEEGDGYAVEPEKADSAPSIGNTAAGQMVGALDFYANQGFDHGVRARKALVGMSTVLNAKEGAGFA